MVTLREDGFQKASQGLTTVDEVLRVVADRLKGCLRDSDILGRYGGEEFMVVLPETDSHGARTLAERLRKAIESQPIPVNDVSLPVTISLGITEIRTDTKNYEQLIGEADQGLYQSKEDGRNRTTVYTDGAEC